MGVRLICGEIDATAFVVIALLVSAAMAGVAIHYGLALSRHGYSRPAKSMLIASIVLGVIALAAAYLMIVTINGSGY